MADTSTMPLVFILSAFAVVTELMIIGMRQRWILDMRGRWEPDAEGRWEPGARGRWEPGAGAEARPLPRAYWVLAAVGWGVLLSGILLALLLGDPLIGSVGLVAYVATWIARMVLIDWIDATSRIFRIAAILWSGAFVAGIGLTVITRSIWWFVIGAGIFLVIRPTVHFIQKRRRDRGSRWFHAP